MPAAKHLRCFLVPALSSALAACAAEGAPPDRSVPTPSTTITLTVDLPPALVAVRDGLAASWQPATRKTPTVYVAEVHGPYLITVVCDLASDGSPGTAVTTWQAARTLDDPLEISTPCKLSPVPRTVTGHMVQSGHLHVGPRGTASQQAEWDFRLALPDGTYDLVATAADRIAVRRGIAINIADAVVMPPVDVAQEGVALGDVAFTATNAAPDETVEVAVGLLTPTNTTVPAYIYSGPLATAKAAPDGALLGTDIQSVSVRANRGGQMRALRRPFRVGGDTAFTLPPPIGDPAWTSKGGQLVASWSTLPPMDALLLWAYGPLRPPVQGSHEVNLSRSFLDATGITQATLETDIPGYKPEWRVGVSGSYTRQVFAQQGTETAVVMTSWVTETIR